MNRYLLLFIAVFLLLYLVSPLWWLSWSRCVVATHLISLSSAWTITNLTMLASWLSSQRWWQY